MIKIDSSYPILVGESILNELSKFIEDHFQGYRIFVLVDENTEVHCLPLFNWTNNQALLEADILSVPAGEGSKTIDIYSSLAETLLELGATRKSLLLNLGGGMITDLGGFLASSFKRGIPFVNVPTTLLSMVDASAGGKTGINVGEYKNQLGTFCFPEAVFCGIQFLETLPVRELKSGFVESIKHSLIANQDLWKKMVAMDLDVIPHKSHIAESIRVKAEIVGRDFKEQGERKKLNFGHTLGHAIESLSLSKGNPLLHGEAVAIGIVIESLLSQTHTNLSKASMDEIRDLILERFEHKKIDEEDFQALMVLMGADKKNEETGINFSLLTNIGSCRTDIVLNADEIKDALNWYNTLI